MRELGRAVACAFRDYRIFLPPSSYQNNRVRLAQPAYEAILGKKTVSSNSPQFRATTAPGQNPSTDLVNPILLYGRDPFDTRLAIGAATKMFCNNVAGKNVAGRGNSRIAPANSSLVSTKDTMSPTSCAPTVGHHGDGDWRQLPGTI